jgi:hypothetical protein
MGLYPQRGIMVFALTTLVVCVHDIWITSTQDTYEEHHRVFAN